MKKTFKEYHRFSKAEFKQIWEKCLFVFDTNTLLDLYRYSKQTVDAYFEVLNELKNKKQLWLPYQVGYEFHENRVNVISEYEKSYDDILHILEDSKTSIQKKYKDHPFLDLAGITEEINRSLAGVENKIKDKQRQHPRWLEEDEVLEKINDIFNGSVGPRYDEKRLAEIRKEGEERYAKKIPPGFKDLNKSEDKRFGDLILWYQIIDRAKEVQRPIILISGDTKEDWWLEKDGKRIMPLPHLKKEMLDKAGVDFHIYTADRFLEYAKNENKKIDEKTIKEVHKISQLEEERIRAKRFEGKNIERIEASRGQMRLAECIWAIVSDLVNNREIGPKYSAELNFIMYNLNTMRSPGGQFDSIFPAKLNKIASLLFVNLREMSDSKQFSDSLSKTIKEYLDVLIHMRYSEN